MSIASPMLSVRLALLLAPLLLPAAELVMRDLRLEVDSNPTAFSYQLKDETGSRSGSDSFDSAYGLGLGARWSFAGPGRSHGLLADLVLVGTRRAYTGGGLTDYGVRIGGGYGWAVADQLTLTGMVEVGGGLATLALDGGGAFPAYNASGSWFGYGLRAGAVWYLTDRLFVDLSATWRTEHQQLGADNGQELSLDVSGIGYALGVGWRLSTMPGRLE